ncbi:MULTISPECIES: hypothetical protein [unclassified Corynebacterium]|uniref:hypothetical protein n=1 Tax=unclassified Corynebacterium TaxID=2624378 RepID=UPI0029C9B5EF|nr:MULTISPECIES: hypothetical protein [unclassified Corynebacterium]WPF66025.1 hypothetical protein OLX12_10820 [Corynebacterium sp. 22KM0430]WPF68518.1 hypothetical protein OLW90_10815 [Corynebacterium sp. 21KM1197]
MSTMTKIDRLWSVRMDLHARFGADLSIGLIDAVLDGVARRWESSPALFRTVLIEREAVEELEHRLHGGMTSSLAA